MALSLSLIIQPSVPLPWQNGPLADTLASNNGLLCVCLRGGGGWRTGEGGVTPTPLMTLHQPRTSQLDFRKGERESGSGRDSCTHFFFSFFFLGHEPSRRCPTFLFHRFFLGGVFFLARFVYSLSPITPPPSKHPPTPPPSAQISQHADVTGSLAPSQLGYAFRERYR